jgi:hypothetical protein
MSKGSVSTVEEVWTWGAEHTGRNNYISVLTALRNSTDTFSERREE